MSEFFKQLIGQLAIIWRRLSLQQKLVTTALVAFTVLGMAGLIIWSQSGTKKRADSRSSTRTWNLKRLLQ